MSEKGLKYDYGKVRPTLVIDSMREAILAVSKVGTFGAEKYDDDNWKLVKDGEKRYRDAAYRHLLAEGCDEESGLPHLAHAAWNLLALLQLRCEAAQKGPSPLPKGFLSKHFNVAPEGTVSLSQPTQANKVEGAVRPMNVQPTCRSCGEYMVGDGVHSVMTCPNYDGDTDVAPDSNPIYCQGESDGS